jgi:O-antigen/teichoic acid export membrane protein
MMGLRQRLVRAAGANALAQVINLLHRIVLPPLFLTQWGVGGYADWMILSSLIAYVSLAELGGTGYISNVLTRAYTQGDVNLYRKVANTGLAMVTFPALIASLAGMALLMLFGPERLFGLQTITGTSALMVIGILGFQLLLTLPLGLLYRVYWSVGKQARSLMLYNTGLALQLASVSVTLVWHCGPVVVAIASLLPYTLVGAFALYDLRRNFTEFRLLSPQYLELATARSLLKPSLTFWFIGFSQMLMNQGLTVTLGVVLGASALVLFVTTRTIANSIKQLTGLFVNTAWPELTRLHALEDSAALTRMFRVVIRSAMLTTCVLLWVFHQYGEQIFSIWLGTKVAFDQRVLDLMLAYVAQWTFWSSCSGLLVAISHHRRLARILAINAITAVFFAWAGAELWDLEGAIIGMIAADLVLPFWWLPLYVRRQLSIVSLRGLFKEFSVPTLFLMLSLALPYLAVPVLALGLLWWWSGLSERKTMLAQ